MEIDSLLASAGIDIRDIATDLVGQWQRVPTTDKPSKKNGSVLVFSTKPLKLYYRNFATGAEGLYSESDVRRRCSQPTLQAQLERRRQRSEDQAAAAARAQRIWNRAQTPSEHRYLKTKGIEPHGVRQIRETLIVPMLDADEFVWSCQMIMPDGEKRYLRGGRKKGCLFPLGMLTDGALVLTEGFATGASLRECIHRSVIVCFDAPNLLPVAVCLRDRYPDRRIVLGADNDVCTPGNPGLTAARIAADAVGGMVVYPRFSNPSERLTDWNDMHRRYGAEVVRDLFSMYV